MPSEIKALVPNKIETKTMLADSVEFNPAEYDKAIDNIISKTLINFNILLFFNIMLPPLNISHVQSARIETSMPHP